MGKIQRLNVKINTSDGTLTYDRRMINCAIESQDLGTASEVYGQMNVANQEAAATQFLMFRCALRTEDAPMSIATATLLLETILTECS